MSNCPRPSDDNPWSKRIQGVSFPRTGHNLLVDLLRAYFGPEFNYCEFYNGCKHWPCRRPLNNFQKSHDFQLNTPQLSDTPYIIQIRHPWPAIVSRFRHRLRQGFVEDTRESWLQHLQTESAYYEGFVRRWLLNGNPLQKLTVPYHELIAEPVETLTKIVQLFEEKVDCDRIRQSVRENDVRELSRWADFPHATDETMATIEKLNVLGLPLF